MMMMMMINGDDDIIDDDDYGGCHKDDDDHDYDHHHRHLYCSDDDCGCHDDHADSYEDKEKLVKVLLQGACSGCPSSTLTLKNGIENILKEMLPGKVNLVEAVNG